MAANNRPKPGDLTLHKLLVIATLDREIHFKHIGACELCTLEECPEGEALFDSAHASHEAAMKVLGGKIREEEDAKNQLSLFALRLVK